MHAIRNLLPYYIYNKVFYFGASYDEGYKQFIYKKIFPEPKPGGWLLMKVVENAAKGSLLPA